MTELSFISVFSNFDLAFLSLRASYPTEKKIGSNQDHSWRHVMSILDIKSLPFQGALGNGPSKTAVSSFIFECLILTGIPGYNIYFVQFLQYLQYRRFPNRPVYHSFPDVCGPASSLTAEDIKWRLFFSFPLPLAIGT